MKKISFFALALAAGLMMGCSDEVGNDVNPGGTGSATVGEGFMSVAINLPTTTGGSRASVDGFEDGLESEYAVKDGQLIIFGGASETAATYQASYTLTGLEKGWNEGPNAQITTTKTITVSTTDMTGPNFYAFVILNSNGQDLGLTATSKISDLEGKIWNNVTSDQLKANGFLMTNAPLATKQGGVSNPTGLTIMKYPSFDKTKIKSDAQAAMQDPAATIYVERIHAKVTLTEGQTMTSPSTALGTMDILAWALDNTNKSTYLMRNTNTGDGWWGYKSTKTGTTPSPEYRFVENAAVADGLYRTYWCTDPNYNTAYAATNFNTITDADLKTTFGANNPQYCFENTFNTDYQTEQNTTAAIVKVQFNGGKDFYVANSNYNVIYDAAGAQGIVKGMLQDYLETVKEQYIKNGNITGEDITSVTLTQDAAKKVSATAITLGDCAGVTEWADGQSAKTLETALNDYLTELNKNLNVYYYQGGVAYYRLLIKHFGDEDTPWAEADKANGDSYPDVAGGASGENQWLGRYGMVRNNWYDLTVTGARELGSPTIPEVTNTYDDDVNNLAVTINILSWAKRTQNVEL